MVLTASLIQFSRLLIDQAHPLAGRSYNTFSQIFDFNFIFAQNYMLGGIACQIRGKELSSGL
jgi:hypothetical protein